MVDTLEVVADRVRTHKGDLSRVFDKVGAVEDKQHQADLKQAGFESAIAELGGMKGSIESISEKMDTVISTVHDIDARVKVIESKAIDFVKVFKFFSTWKGVFLILGVFGMIMYGEDWSLAVLKIIKPG